MPTGLIFIETLMTHLYQDTPSGEVAVVLTFIIEHTEFVI